MSLAFLSLKSHTFARAKLEIPQSGRQTTRSKQVFLTSVTIIKIRPKPVPFYLQNSCLKNSGLEYPRVSPADAAIMPALDLKYVAQF